MRYPIILVLFIVNSIYAQWKVINPYPTPDDIVSIAKNSSIYVVATRHGNIFSSPDAKSWNFIHNASSTLKKIKWIGNIFIAVGDGIHISNDGYQWVKVEESLRATWADVTWTGSEFVAVGGNYISKSNNASNWITTSSGLADSINIRNIIWADSTFFTFDGKLKVSKDLKTWSKVTLPRRGNINSMTWTGSKVVAVGSGWNYFQNKAAMWYSDIDSSWVFKEYNSSYPFLDFCVADSSYGIIAENLFFEIAFNGNLIQSLNFNYKNNDFLWKSILYDSEKYVAVGSYGLIAESKNGREWTKTSFGTTQTLKRIISGRDDALFIGAYSTLHTKDFINFIEIDSSNSPCAVWTGSEYFSIKHYDFKIPDKPWPLAMLNSSDGINWEVSHFLNDSVTGECVDMTISNSKFYILINHQRRNISPSAASVIYSSDDGASWNMELNVDSLYLNKLVVIKDSLFVLGRGWLIMKNVNNIWRHVYNNPNPSHSYEYYESMTAHNQNIFAIVQNKLYTSYDFKNWEEKDMGLYPELNEIVWTGKKFVIIGADGLISESLDGNNWIQQRTRIGVDLGDIEIGTNHLFASGMNGAILIAPNSDSISYVNHNSKTNYNLLFQNGKLVLDSKKMVELISIYNLKGERVINKIIFNKNRYIDVSFLKSGVYFIYGILKNKETFQKSFIITKY